MSEPEWRHRELLAPKPMGTCAECGQPWPCDAEQMRLSLDAERARLAVLTEALQAFLAVRDEDPPRGPDPTTTEVERFWRAHDVRESMALIRLRAALANLPVERVAPSLDVRTAALVNALTDDRWIDDLPMAVRKALDPFLPTADDVRGILTETTEAET